jgi:hypothetical protein
MTTVQERRDRLEIDCLKNEILASLAADPSDFDGREPLWMRLSDLRARQAT